MRRAPSLAFRVAVACSIGSTTAWLNSQASACTVPPSRRITRESAITSASWGARSTVTERCVSDELNPAAARREVSASDSSAALDHVSPGLSEKRRRTS